jgi:glycosyltransferase involved in cell wall biosynthesis
MPQDALPVLDARAAALRPLHRLWRWLPARPRRALLAYGAARLAPRAGPRPAIMGPPCGVVVGGEVTQASGLGEGARILHASIAALGVPSWLIEAGLPVPGMPADEAAPARDLSMAPPGAPLILCVNAPLLPAALLRLRRARLRGRLVIGFWNWELPVAPATWRAARDLVHEIWVPSRFTADAIAALPPRAGGEMPRVIPYPLALCPPAPAAMDRAAFGLPGDAVIVLVSFNLASSFARKNPLGAIAAFRAAFGDRTDRLLVLKIGKPAHYPEDLARIRDAARGVANIRIETRSFSSAARHALTACADIVLSLHRAEGFGLVAAEAMLLGRPVVATGWSGNLEFMDDASAALVGYRLVPAVDPRGVYAMPGAVWAEPDIAEAAARLRHLAEDAAAREALGARGQAAARARLGAAPLEAALRAIGAMAPACGAR